MSIAWRARALLQSIGRVAFVKKSIGALVAEASDTAISGAEIVGDAEAGPTTLRVRHRLIESPGRPPPLPRRHSPQSILSFQSCHASQRTLGPIDLVCFGIGCIIGAGVYVLTGHVAATTTGPALVISMLIAAFSAGLVRPEPRNHDYKRINEYLFDA
jgi:hypothetical protein